MFLQLDKPTHKHTHTQTDNSIKLAKSINLCPLGEHEANMGHPEGLQFTGSRHNGGKRIALDMRAILGSRIMWLSDTVCVCACP